MDSAGNVTAQFVGNLMLKNGNTYEFITDHLACPPCITFWRGSVRLVVDVNTGDVAQKIEYDEFGNITADSNPDFQPFAYAGGLYDSQTKLVRFGARDYDAISGRWTCKDPIQFKGKQSNIYVYVNNNPTNNLDRLGLGDDPCDKRRREIQNAIDKVLERYNEMKADPSNLYLGENPDKGSWEGHQEAMRQAQNRLENAINKFNNSNCPGGLPSGAEDAVNLNVPDRPDPKNEMSLPSLSPEQMKALQENAAKAAAVSFGMYLLYSLFILAL
jgi:RHS repeat-associated protein